jgi:hypothetical protein
MTKCHPNLCHLGRIIATDVQRIIDGAGDQAQLFSPGFSSRAFAISGWTLGIKRTAKTSAFIVCSTSRAMLTSSLKDIQLMQLKCLFARAKAHGNQPQARMPGFPR